MFVHNTRIIKYYLQWIMKKKKMFICNTWIMKISIWKHMNYEKLKYLLSIHELWKYLFKYMNYEKMKTVRNAWIMKIFFAINEFYKIKKCFVCNKLNYKIKTMFVCNKWIMKTWPFLLILHEFWKHESVCMQYMNYEKRKNIILQYIMNIFVCKTWIMKIWKYLFAIHDYENICWHYINYEKIKMLIRNTWIMKNIVWHYN